MNARPHALTLVLAATAHLAYAQAPGTPPVAVLPESGYYVFTDLGVYHYRNAPDSSLAGALLGGGYRFNRYLGLEGGLSIIEESSHDNSFDIFASSPQESLGADSYQIGATGTLPLNDKFDLIGKIGWAYTSLRHSYSYTPCSILGCYGSTVTGSGNASGTNPMFAIGWQWSIVQASDGGRLKMRVLYENLGSIKLTSHFSDQTSRTYDIGIEVLSVGILYNFRPGD